MIPARTVPVRLLTLLFALSPIAMDAGAQSQPKAFATGDAKVGKVLNEKDCVACHARRFDDKPDEMYLRSDRKVRTPEQLITQIGFCNSQLGTNYFPEEEEHVAAYLNLQYYKFKP